MNTLNARCYGEGLIQLDAEQRELFDDESLAFATWAAGRFQRFFEFGTSYGRTSIAVALEGLSVTSYEASDLT
ncbi:hypothetical protein [Brachybacterium sp. Marseille-Q7125]|uniref:hypothetical protein n=1 Tax=Brachybacterium sp. Marseille-Q7125 TaxID=2932815 RepID=UPI001FF223FB|nr:hypothetical protein [Brachybacterium sp. Marseille-Q7125]